MANKIEHRSWILNCRSRVVGGALVIGAVFLSIAPALRAQETPTYTEKALYSFTGGTDGGAPFAGVIRDREGNVYGTTYAGGDLSADYGRGAGVVFKVDPKGNETVLYAFTGGADGGGPVGGLVADWKGNLYGTTSAGGDLSASCGGDVGCGVVFKLDPNGNETVLHTFTGGSDGGSPGQESLILDAWGGLYGTTEQGGDLSGVCYYGPGCGVVFKVDPKGKETVLYTFTGGTDGGTPFSGLTLDVWGNLYGSTISGGDLSGLFCSSIGCGIVYKLDFRGKETVLHTFTGGSFQGGSDGSQPTDSLVLDARGNLYGTTTYGGNPGDGTVFKLSRTGNETVLYNFTDDFVYGENGAASPEAGLTLDSKGNLYGTAFEGAGGGGVVFQVDSDGKYTVLYSFTGVDGAQPYSGVILDCEGNLYGTTRRGGTYDGGVVYKLTRSHDDRH